MRDRKPNEEPCLHIGLVKTGTTTLQMHLFSRHSEIAFLGLFGHAYHDDRLQQLADAVRGCSPEDYSELRCRQLYQETILPLLETGRVALLSDERLTSRVWRNPSVPVRTIEGVDHDIIAKRLAGLFGSWKVMMTIRNQADLLWSWYLHDCRNATIEASHWIESRLEEGDSGPLGALKYFEMAERYAALFGRDKLAIFTFEDMVRDPQTFARKIAVFIGVNEDEAVRLLTGKPENVRVSRRMMLYHRLRFIFFRNVDLHQYLPQPVRQAGYWFLRRGRPTELKMPPDWRPLIRELYRESNRRLSQAYQLPLRELKYPL